MAESFRDDLARLAVALEEMRAPAQTMGSERRVIYPCSTGSAKDALLREIDQTVLRRRLSFCNDHDQRIVLVVGERQVESAEVADGSGAVMDASGLRALLARFAAGSGHIWVRSELTAEGGFSGLSGISVQDLAVQDPDDAADLCRDVFRLCSGAATSVVVCSAGTPPATSGATDWCERLEALARDMDEIENSQIDDTAPTRMTIWHPPSGAGVSIARVGTATCGIWIAFERAHFKGLMTALTTRFCL